MSVTLAQGPTQGTASILSGTFTINLNQTPVSGNVLILDFVGSADSANPILTNVSQTGVTWSQIVTPDSGSASFWKGTVRSSAQKTLTLMIASGSGGDLIGIADFCEWSGLSGVVDETASDTGGSANLWIQQQRVRLLRQTSYLLGLTRGAVVNAGQSAAQSSPTHSFTVLDGANIADSSGETTID